MTGYVLKPDYLDLATEEQIDKFEDIILNEVLVLAVKDDNGNLFFKGPCDDNLHIVEGSAEYQFIKQVYKFQKL
jgi:hypothetical protein